MALSTKKNSVKLTSLTLTRPLAMLNLFFLKRGACLSCFCFRTEGSMLFLTGYCYRLHTTVSSKADTCFWPGKLPSPSPSAGRCHCTLCSTLSISQRHFRCRRATHSFFSARVPLFSPCLAHFSSSPFVSFPDESILIWTIHRSNPLSDSSSLRSRSDEGGPKP
jgi:hypothetical protein